MCTATFIARRNGYVLGMNRDEQRTRVPAHPAALHRLGDRQALFPSEPSGGTWMGVNDRGTAFALLNWYSVPKQVTKNALSRGDLVRQALRSDTTAEVAAFLTGWELPRVNPFRLVGIFPETKTVVEWQWDLRNLQQLEHPWQTTVWISSGFDEPAAQRIRGQTFREALHQNSAGTQEWLRRLHRSHRPSCGPTSICMHRTEAVSVSYTQLAVSPTKASLRYTPGPPCCTKPEPALHLDLHPTRCSEAEPSKAHQPSSQRDRNTIRK